MTATAGLIGVVSWSVQALGQLEQQRTQKNTLETLLESSEKDQATVHSSADGREINRPPTKSVLQPTPAARPLGAPGTRLCALLC